MSESSTTAPAATTEESLTNDVAVNYTISSPLRKTFRASVEKDHNNDDEKISATFTMLPPPKTNTNAISLLANRLEKGLDLVSDVEANSINVSATINVPLIINKSNLDASDRLKNYSLKTEDPNPFTPLTHQKIPPTPQPRSLFDIDNATSVKLADKLQQEAKKCDANAIHDGPLSGEVSEPLPPSPIHHTIFGERRTSWRLKSDFTSKVNYVKI